MRTTTLWIGTQSDPADRTQIDVTLDDEKRIPPRGSEGSAVVINQRTGKRVTVRRASCGIPHCLCALEFVTDH